MAKTRQNDKRQGRRKWYGILVIRNIFEWKVTFFLVEISKFTFTHPVIPFSFSFPFLITHSEIYSRPSLFIYSSIIAARSFQLSRYFAIFLSSERQARHYHATEKESMKKTMMKYLERESGRR